MHVVKIKSVFIYEAGSSFLNGFSTSCQPHRTSMQTDNGRKFQTEQFENVGICFLLLI